MNSNDQITSTDLLNKLEEIRFSRDLNISDFAALLGISHDTYYRWKKGETPKAMATFVRIYNFCKEENIL
jgi:transcriptional regulator with XRE-family HTH domain